MRYMVERTNKAKIRPEEHSEKMESCREILRYEIQLKGPKKDGAIDEWSVKMNFKKKPINQIISG